MDAISERVFTDTAANTAQNIHKVIDETPSLLTVILDLHPLEWKAYLEKNESISFQDVTSAMIVMLNSHLALNSGNQVSLYVANSFYHGAKRVYPEEENLIVERGSDLQKSGPDETIGAEDGSPKQQGATDNGSDGNNDKRPADDDDDDDDDDEKIQTKVKTSPAPAKRTQLLKSTGIYGQFKAIDEKILGTLNKLFEVEPERLRDIVNKEKDFVKGTMTGAISTALTAINKLQSSDTSPNMKARVMILSVSVDNTLPYVSMMNTIFAAQKMKVSIDVCKLGEKSIFLQQTCDATNGVYIDIKHPTGLMQYLSNALFIEPLLRPILVLPTNTSVDFRASCFVSNKVIDIGYVCSVCLCILSMIPSDEKCPTCYSKFEHKLITRLKRKPKVLPLDVKKKKKTA